MVDYQNYKRLERKVRGDAYDRLVETKRRTAKDGVPKGNNIFNLDPFDTVDEKIPRQRGFWFTSGKHRTRRVVKRPKGMRHSIKRNSDYPNRDPDRPPKKPKTINIAKDMNGRFKKWAKYGRHRRYEDHTKTQTSTYDGR